MSKVSFCQSLTWYISLSLLGWEGLRTLNTVRFYPPPPRLERRWPAPLRQHMPDEVYDIRPSHLRKSTSRHLLFRVHLVWTTMTPNTLLLCSLNKIEPPHSSPTLSRPHYNISRFELRTQPLREKSPQSHDTFQRDFTFSHSAAIEYIETS